VIQKSLLSANIFEINCFNQAYIGSNKEMCKTYFANCHDHLLGNWCSTCKNTAWCLLLTSNVNFSLVDWI